MQTSTCPSPSFHVAKSVNAKGDGIGNGIFASRSFEAGEEFLALKRPLVASLDSRFLQDSCANCYVWTEGASNGTRLYVPEGVKVQTCTGCQRFRYCSKTCQKAAWNRGHKYECKSLRRVAGKEIPKAVLACMEILSRRKHGLIDGNEWTALCQLKTHVDDFQKFGTYENIELMARGANEFSLTQDQFDISFVAGMYARVLTNSLTLITPTLDPLGLVLDPLLGQVNHSCDPNAFIMMSGPSVSIRTLKAIKKGEEVYISYVDVTNPYLRRQSELQARWFFVCECRKCQSAASLQEDAWARTPVTLPRKIQDVADTIMTHEKSAQGAVNPVGESLDERRAAAIQGKAFAEYEEAQNMQDAAGVIEKIEDIMRLCHQSGLWPMHRQPYAALRDDLIVNLLSAGQFVVAWAHCAKRYKYILPTLYPVSFHPVRVMQTWQMAVLAIYLASTPDGVGTPGVRMDLIAMMLVQQVVDATSMSHGSNSIFTMSVKRKAEEMTEEMRRIVNGEPDKEALNRELELQREMLMQMGDWIEP